MSQLANQLAALAANNASVVQDKKRKKKLHTVSLVYEPKVAANQTFDDIYIDSIDALLELQALDPRFKAFETSLFSDTSKTIDRLVQTKEQNDMLDKAIENFLSLVAPRIKLRPALRALEWLVRRFQVHYYNTELLLLTFLPYYSSEIFVRMLDICPEDKLGIFSFLAQSKKTLHPPSRNLMVRALSSNSQLFEFVATYIVRVIQHHREYHDILAFWSSTTIWTLVSLKEAATSADDIVSKVLPHVSAALPLKKQPEAQIAAYMILAVLQSQCDLSLEVRTAAIHTISRNWSAGSYKAGLACITQLVSEDDELDSKTWNAINNITVSEESIDEELVNLAGRYNIARFLVAWSRAMFNEESGSAIASVVKVIKKTSTPSGFEYMMAADALDRASAPASTEQKTSLVELFEFWFASSPQLIKSAMADKKLSVDDLELALQSSINGATSEPAVNGGDGDIDMGDGDSEASAPGTKINKKALASAVESVSSQTDSFLVESTEELTQLAAIFSQSALAKSHSLLAKIESKISFLARIWSSAYPLAARAFALTSVVKLIEEADNTDFQALIPTLLAALSDESERIRRLAATVLDTLHKKYAKGFKRPVIWALDTIYGKEASVNVKFANTEQIKTLLGEYICADASLCVMDPEHIVSVIKRVFDSGKKLGDPLWMYLASHALSVPVPQLKTAFLKMVNSRKGKSDLRLFAPLLESWIENRTHWQSLCSVERTDFGALEQQVVSIVTTGDKQALSFIEDCIQSNAELAEVAATQLVKNWSHMRADSQLSITKVLIDSALNESVPYDTLSVLHAVKMSVNHFVSLLRDCQLATNEEESVKKRRRRSSANATVDNKIAGIAEKHIRKLSVVLELLERSDELGSVEILTQLFNILADVLLIPDLPVEFTLQSIANCMINVVVSLKQKNQVGLNSNANRIDLIVNCIRGTSSPQVQNRFLLLVSHLATLDREMVLHGVMPIFTFMGANTLRQDDEFSAHVIQQTIANVIPSLFHDNAGKIEDLDVLLKSFVTAFPHIPRHRRVKMFTTLVSTLGVEASYYRFLVLVGAKYHDAKKRRRQQEAYAFVQFFDSFARTFTPFERVHGILQYLEIVDTIPTSPTEEEVALVNVTNALTQDLIQLKTSLYSFVTEIITDILKQQNQAVDELEECSLIIQNLLTARSQLQGVSKELDDAVFSLLGKILELLTVDKFVIVVGKLVDSPADGNVKLHALKLIKSKFDLELASDETASQAAVEAVAILKKTVEVVGENDSDMCELCLDCLDIIVSKFGHNMVVEEVVSLLDLAVVGIKSSSVGVYVASVALSNTVCSIVGARMVGYFAKIVPPVLARTTEAIETGGESDEGKSVQLAMFGLVGGFIKRIPAFMTTSLPTILEKIMKSTVDYELRQKVLDSIVYGMDTKSVANSLSGCWKHAKDFDSISLFVEAMDKTVDRASKKDIAVHAPALVSWLLTAFQVRGNGKFDTNDTNRIEHKLVHSGIAVVMKLNDKKFRPLFVRMVRWAIDGEGAAGIDATSRRIVFWKFLGKVLNSLKSIVTNYYGYLVDPVCDILATTESESLRRLVLSSLITSFQYDQDEFWHAQARFDKISKALLAQIPLIDINSTLGNVLVKAITNLAELCSSLDTNKQLNDGLSVYLKENNTSTAKIWAIRTLKGLYGSSLGEEWVSMLPQLVPLIAELLEDEDEKVENEVRRELVPVVEDVLGEDLDRYLS